MSGKDIHQTEIAAQESAPGHDLVLRKIGTGVS